jgi:rubrerythrin
MTLEEAIRTAITFEINVQRVYSEEAARTTDEAARKVLTTLALEEQGHVDYLVSRLAEWTADGRLSPAVLESVIPSRELIEAGVGRLEGRMRMTDEQRDASLATLRRALEAELETAAFYRKMVHTLPPGDGKSMFARFLEIEDGHGAIVSAEIDTVTGLGFWFDTREFDLEVG